MSVKVYIDGQEGTTGLKIVERLSGRNDIELMKISDELRKDKTTLFVSHRLSSAATASKIIVLLNGEVAEIGTHAELMKKQGHYYKLFSTQAKRYIDAEEAIRNTEENQ